MSIMREMELQPDRLDLLRQIYAQRGISLDDPMDLDEELKMLAVKRKKPRLSKVLGEAHPLAGPENETLRSLLKITRESP